MNYDTHQDKYGNSFYSDLEVSQELVNEVCKRITNSSPDIYVRAEDDATPMVNQAKKNMRFLDVWGFDDKSKNHFYVEVKDFCSMGAYNATGLPAPYVTNKLLVFDPTKVYVIFRDNEEFYKQRIANGKELLPTYYIGNDCKMHPIPYGERLDVLMANRVPGLEKRIKCNWKGAYHGQEQFIWNTEVMKPIEHLMLRDFSDVRVT